MLVCLGGCAAIVAVQQLHIVGVGTYHCQRLDVLREGQHIVVFQQHHRLACCLRGQCVVLLAAYHVLAQLGPRQALGRVEHAQLESPGKRAAQVHIEVTLLDQAFCQSLRKVHKHLSALQVCAIQNCID